MAVAGPKDRYGLVALCMVVLGLSVLLGWNVLVTEAGFYFVRLQVPPNIDYLAKDVIGSFGVVYNVATIFGIMVLLVFQNRISLVSQILPPLVFLLFVMGFQSVLALQPELSGTQMAYATIPCVAILGACSALLMAGVFDLARQFPPAYIQAVVIGISLGGVIVSCVSFFSTLFSSPSSEAPTPEDVADAAFIFFLVFSALVLLAILCYLIMNMLDFTQWHLYRTGTMKSLPSNKDLQALLLAEKDAEASGGPDEEEVSEFGSASSHLSALEWQDYMGGGDAPPGHHPHPHKHPPVKPSLYQFSLYGFAIVFDFFVSLIAQSGVFIFICSVHNSPTAQPGHCASDQGRLYGDLFTPLKFMLLFGGDLLGRLLAGMGPWGRRAPRGEYLVLYAIARLGIVIGLLFCKVSSPDPWGLPNYLASDWYAWGLSLALGMTQGHLVSVASVHAPAVLPDEYGFLYGPVMSLSSTLGCLVGALLSFDVVQYFERPMQPQPPSPPPPFQMHAPMHAQF